MALTINVQDQTIRGTVAGVTVIGYEQNGGWYEVWRAGDEDRSGAVSLGMVQVTGMADLPAAEAEIAAWLAN